MQDLLHEAFSRFARTASQQLRNDSPLPDADTAKKAIADAITHTVLSNQRDLVLTHELYTLAAREAGYRDTTHAWMARSRGTLEQFFDPTTARILDALVEGFSIHRALDNEPDDQAIVSAAVQRITAKSEIRRV
jgi:TetR/AcrR family transcriptional regulator, regulator of biofilm formation and stress response